MMKSTRPIVCVWLLAMTAAVPLTGCQLLLDRTGLGDVVGGGADADVGFSPNPDPRAPDPIDGLCELTMEEQDEFFLTNQARAEAGVAAYACDEALVIAARLHADDMCARDYFDHDSPDGRSVGDRLTEAGAQWSMAGENIAWGYETAEGVHEGWMTSEGHRSNILDPSFGRIGVGVVWCSTGPLWVQTFAD